MIESIHGPLMRTHVIFAAFVALSGASSCGAPDARPGAEEPVLVPGGEPLWGHGFGDFTSADLGDQHAFDVAFDPTSNSVVSTIGFFKTIEIPGVNGDMPFISGTPPAATRNILVLKYAADDSKAVWATNIFDDLEIIRTTVDVDPEGNTIVAGGFNGTIKISDTMNVTTSNSYDAYIAKFDPDGKARWVQSFGALGEQYATDVATDAEGNIVVVGMARGDAFPFGTGVVAPKATDADIFIAKFDPDGKAMWAKRVGAAGPMLWYEPTATVAVSRTDGSIVVGGSHAAALNFGLDDPLPAAGDENGFVAKLEPTGQGIWQFAFGATGYKQRVTDVAFGPKNDVFFTGWFSGSLTIGPDELKSFNDTEDLVVAKLDPNGVPVWARGYGYLGKQSGTKVLLDEQGYPLVVGSFNGALQFFGNDTLVSPGPADPKTDIFAVKFTGDGKPFWARSYGDATKVLGWQTVGGAALWKDPAGKGQAILVGLTNTSVDLGSAVPPIASQGLEDAFMMAITH